MPQTDDSGYMGVRYEGGKKEGEGGRNGWRRKAIPNRTQECPEQKRRPDERTEALSAVNHVVLQIH